MDIPKTEIGAYSPSSDGLSALPLGAAAAVRLIDALEVSLLRPAAVDGELKDALCEYVAQRRSEGLSSGRILAAVKRLVAKVDVSAMADRDNRAALVRGIMTLCIDEYYRVGSDTNGRATLPAARQSPLSQYLGRT